MTTEATTLWSETIGHLQLKPAISVSENDSLESCLQKMHSSNDPFIVILDDDQHLSGVYTARDFMNSFLGTNLSKDTQIGAIMRRETYTFDAKQTIRDAMTLFGQQRFSQVPVIENEKILGILTVEALLDYISECFPEELIKRPPQKD